ncbi:AAA family ATPase [Streptomyces sp. NPDC096339]|uniref:AAA family ATPase n=1 Tax=Streptomyces sp. NPDC096339 TaxID=3366086 RepID=UPI0037FFCA5D
MASIHNAFGWKVLRDTLADAIAGYGRTALVTGPVASGKTTLLSSFAEYAARRGVLVLRADCSRFMPNGPLSLARRLTGAQSESPHDSGLPSEEEELEADEAIAHIVELSYRSTVLVCVDDLRHAHPASAAFLARLASAIGDRPVLVVATDRMGAPNGYHWLAQELTGRSTFRKISLTSIPPEQLVALAEAEFNLVLDADTASRLLRLSNGNMLVTRALLRDLVADRDLRPALGETTQVPIGPGYAPAVLETLHRLDPEIREIAEVIAAAGEHESARLIAEISGNEIAVVEEAMRELVAAGLLAAGGFRHEVARGAILGDMPRRRRVALGKQTAIALKDAGASTEDAAQWLESFQNGPVSPRPPQRSTGDDFRISGRRLETLWDARDILGTIDQGIHDLTAREDLRLMDLEGGKLLVAAEFPGLLRQAVEERSLRRRIDTTSVQGARYAAAWSFAGTLTGRTDPVRAGLLADQALERSIFTDEMAPATLAALWAHVYGGRSERARSWCDRFLADTTDHQAVAWRASLTALRAEAALRTGDHAGAVADAARALRLLPASRWGVRIGGPLGTLLHAHTLAGTSAKGAALLRRRLPESMFETRYGLGYLYARGHHYLATGEHLLGLADFLRCGRILANWNLDQDWRVPWRLSVAATYMAMGDYSKSVEYIEQAPDQPGPPSLGLGAEESHFNAREAIFEQLREAIGTPGLATVAAGLQSGGLLAGMEADVPRYKIFDRNTVCLQQLSPSERRVAVLAAKGVSNQKIAHELSVTVSTVEQHLTRTYRKLQLADRQELRSRLG